jgi:uncharacterized membrane protein YsdA (DUF1294 family)
MAKRKIDEKQWIAISIIGATVGIIVNEMYNHVKTTIKNNKVNGATASASPEMQKIEQL